jgi:hypothetical protein
MDSLIAILTEPYRLLIDYSSNDKIRNRSVSAVTRLWAGQSDTRGSILDGYREINLPHSIQTAAGAHRAVCPIVTADLSLRI